MREASEAVLEQEGMPSWEDAPILNADEPEGRRPEAEWSFHSQQWEAWQSPAREKVVVAGRRGGKSELSVRWVLAGAKDDDLKGTPGVSWVIVPAYPMARILWRKFESLAPEGWITDKRGTDRLPDRFMVGRSVIEFKSADAPERLVGEGLRRVAMDECGIMADAVWEESVRPTLLDHKAPALMTGTPKVRNWFYRQYARGLAGDDPMVATFAWPTTANPWIDPEEVYRLKAEMPERLYRQEILAQFLDSEGQVFRNIRACVAPLSLERTAVYGVDLARKADYTVVIGLDAEGRMTYLHRMRNVDWPQQRAYLEGLAGGRHVRFVVDQTGVGDPVVQDLKKAGLSVLGFIFTAKSKRNLVDGLAVAFENATIRVSNDLTLLNELEAYTYVAGATGPRYSAPEGQHDDCVMALALAVHGLRRKTPGISIGEPTLVKPWEDSPVERHPDNVYDRANDPGWMA